MVKKKLLAGFFLLFLVFEVRAKDWRGIIPLKSTKADVERLLGKTSQSGTYEIQNEKLSIWYSQGPCEGTHLNLAKENCECLVVQDTVLKITVSLDRTVETTTLGIDIYKFERSPVDTYPPTATYSNLNDGVVYTIREVDHTVTGIDYLPSAADCQEVIRSQPAPTQGWQGIVPFRSTRADAERLLGPPSKSLGDIYTYSTPENRVDVSYSADPCKVPSTISAASAADVVTRITVSPRHTLLVRELSLDKDKYKRIQNTHPDNWVHYLNSAEGIMVDAMLADGCEQVISIIYRATDNERERRCGPSHKAKQELEPGPRH